MFDTFTKKFPRDYTVAYTNKRRVSLIFMPNYSNLKHVRQYDGHLNAILKQDTFKMHKAKWSSSYERNNLKPKHVSCFSKPGRRQSKTSILSTNVDQKSLETEFLIAICRPTGDKWQLKTLSSDFDPRSSIVKSVFDCRLPGVFSNVSSWFF